MPKYPVVDITVSLNELPGEMAVALVFGNCTQKCKGCHSDYLQTPIFTDLWQDLEVLKTKVKKQRDHGATAVVLMGGTTNGVEPGDLEKLIKELATILPVGIYSGLPEKALYHKFLRGIEGLTWLKTGSYIEELGGLETPGTNQKLYQRDNEDWKEIRFV